jgi:hypothetical protein
MIKKELCKEEEGTDDKKKELCKFEEKVFINFNFFV